VSRVVLLVWSTVFMALEDVSVMSSTSSVSCLSVEEFSVVIVSLLGSNTLTVAHISTDDVGTVVVIPEVVGGKWSPDTSG